MMNNKYLFSFLFCVTILFSQNPPSYKLLWKVTAKNSSKPSYLFGTMHVSDKRVFRFSDSLLPALYRAEAFAGELNFENIVPKMMGLIFVKKKSHIREEMTKEEYEVLDEKIQNTFGMPFDSMNTQDTWLYEMFLSRGKEDGYHKDKETFLDTYLGALAAQNKKDILGLETLEEYSDWNNRLTDKQKAKILLGLVKEKEDEEEENNNDTVRTPDQLMEIYCAGDVQKMHEIFMDSTEIGSKFIFSSLYFRNVNMVNRMDSIMKKQSLFAAVGALHLGGDGGMVKLLRAKGYTVEPVAASFNVKKKIPEITKKAYTWSDFNPPKSNFTVLMPMQPFKIPIPSTPGVDLQGFLSLDLSKMNSFICMTLKLGSVISPDKEETFMNAMVQNMVNKQNVEVVSKQFLGAEGLRRMEVIMKKRKSYSKFTLFHKDGEILMLIMYGKKGIVYSEDAVKFSTSVKASGYVPSKTELKTYLDKAKSFSLLMPSQVTETIRNLDNEDGKVHMEMRYNTTPINGVSYYLATYDYDDNMLIGDPKSSVDVMVKRLETKLASWEMTASDTTIENSVAKQYEMENKVGGVVMRGRVLVRDNRVIMYWCSGAKAAINNDDSKAFFSSFKALPYPSFTYKYQFAPDSTYKVRLSNIAKQDTGADYSGVADYMPPMKKEFTNYYNDSITTARYLVYQYALNKYCTLEDPRAILDTMRVNIKDSTTLKDTIIITKEMSYLELLTNGENGSANKTRYVLGPQHLFIIIAFASESTLTSKHTTAIFDSFKPFVKKSVGLVKDPKVQFYKDLASTDSSTAQDAYNAIGYLTFKEKDLPQLEKLFKNDYPLDSIHYRSTKEVLWNRIFALNIVGKLAFGEKYFMANVQNPKDQLCLLNGLSIGMDSTRIPLLKKLIANHTPKLDSLNLSDIKGFYSSTYTSKMFPEAFGLLGNPVWVDFALSLIANAAADSSLSSEDLKPHADKIINVIDQNVLGGKSLAKGNWQYTDSEILHLLSYLNHTRSVELLNKFMAKNEVYTKYIAAEQLLTLDQKLKPADIQYMSNDIFYRTSLYDLLKKFKQDQLFPKRYVNQKGMAIAHLAYYINDEENIDTTSITILKEKVIEYEGKKGRVYLLKYKLMDDEVWYTALSALHDENKKIVDVDQLVCITSYKDLKDMSESEHLEYLIAKLKGELGDE